MKQYFVAFSHRTIDRAERSEEEGCWRTCGNDPAPERTGEIAGSRLPKRFAYPANLGALSSGAAWPYPVHPRSRNGQRPEMKRGKGSRIHETI